MKDLASKTIKIFTDKTHYDSITNGKWVYTLKPGYSENDNISDVTKLQYNVLIKSDDYDTNIMCTDGNTIIADKYVFGIGNILTDFSNNTKVPALFYYDRSADDVDGFFTVKTDENGNEIQRVAHKGKYIDHSYIVPLKELFDMLDWYKTNKEVFDWYKTNKEVFDWYKTNKNTINSLITD